MSDPTGYNASYSFTGFQVNSPESPLPAPRLDDELLNIEQSIATIVAAIMDVRRGDGALKNGLVTYDALDLAVQLMLNPGDASLVAGAVAAAQAAAASASADHIAAANSAASALASAIAAAASAASINLNLYLAKANNLAGLGSVDTSLSNLNGAKWDGTNQKGRLAEFAVTTPIINWNTTVKNGWYYASGASNQPVYANDWLVQVIAVSATYVVQIAYPYGLGSVSVAAVMPHRRVGYDNVGTIAWQPWESMASAQIGSSIMVNGTVVPVGYLKENGALLSRATFPALYAYAAGSGAIVSEATWAANNFGCFSTGDLSTTFRLPDSRGLFIRALDDGSGRDAGRGIGSYQSDTFKDHTHTVTAALESGSTSDITAGSVIGATNGTRTTSGASSSASTETRPVNMAKLICIKY